MAFPEGPRFPVRITKEAHGTAWTLLDLLFIYPRCVLRKSKDFGSAFLLPGTGDGREGKVSLCGAEKGEVMERDGLKEDFPFRSPK